MGQALDRYQKERERTIRFLLNRMSFKLKNQEIEKKKKKKDNKCQLEIQKSKTITLYFD